MKKHDRKKQIIGLCTMICAGMLLFTGCAGKENMDVSDHRNSNAEKNPDPASENKEAPKELDPTTQDGSKVAPTADGEKRTQEQDSFADGNDMMDSADLSGTASGCSDAGCMINTAPFASVDEDGNSITGDGGIKEVVFTEDTVFQKGTVKSDGSSYSLEDSEKSELKDKDYVLCFGNQQADGTYLADRIIVLTFN